jgi:hypothetical protein
MYYLAGLLVVISGILYAAGNQDIGSYSGSVCQLGGMFCDHPSYVFVGAILAAIWGTFVSIK